MNLPSSMTRADKKFETRQRILEAALQLIYEGRSPDSLGLREVARCAGIAAPSIYNHFADMEELRLALVENTLQRMHHIAIASYTKIGKRENQDIIKELLQPFLDYLNQNEAILRLLLMFWFNPNPEFRRIIRREFAIIRAVLVSNMKQNQANYPQLTTFDYETESEAVLALLSIFVLDAINLSPNKREERLHKLEKQLLMLVKGSRILNQEEN